MGFRSREGAEEIERLRLLLEMAFAHEDGDHRRVDRALVRATRWLMDHGGDDPVVREAREELRRGLPVR